MGLRRDQIGLGYENPVGKPDLTADLLARGQLPRRMFGIDQRDDRIQHIVFDDILIHKDRLRHQTGVRDAGRFDDDTVKVELARVTLHCQQGQRFAQIVADATADTAVAHLDDLFPQMPPLRSS